MGFSALEKPLGEPRWYPINCGSGATQVLYVGSLVTMGSFSSAEGVKPIGAAGAGPVTATLPFGIVVGLNTFAPTFSTTYNTVYDTSGNTQALQTARDYRLTASNMYSMGDPAAMALVEPIGPLTVIQGPIYNAAFGTAPSLQTSTAVNATAGLGFTANAIDFTPLASNAIHFCRSGANQGLYRTSYDTSTTVHTFYTYWPRTLAIGDTFVAVNVALGRQKMDFDATSTYVETSAALTNYYVVDVLSLNLEKAGQETVTFRFIGL